MRPGTGSSAPQAFTHSASGIPSARIVPIMSISSAKLGEDIEIPCTCWAETRTAADAGADAADTALAGSKFHVSGREDAYDPEAGLYGTILSINA